MDETIAEATKQRRRAILLHLARPDVQEIFTTSTETGDATDYNRAVEALNAYFVPQVNSAFARQTFHRSRRNQVRPFNNLPHVYKKKQKIVILEPMPITRLEIQF